MCCCGIVLLSFCRRRGVLLRRRCGRLAGCSYLWGGPAVFWWALAWRCFFRVGCRRALSVLWWWSSSCCRFVSKWECLFGFPHVSLCGSSLPFLRGGCCSGPFLDSLLFCSSGSICCRILWSPGRPCRAPPLVKCPWVLFWPPPLLT